MGGEEKEVGRGIDMKSVNGQGSRSTSPEETEPHWLWLLADVPQNSEFMV